METIINQSLGNVIITNTGFFLERPDVNDRFVSNQSVLSCVEKWVGIGKFLGNIVGA